MNASEGMGNLPVMLSLRGCLGEADFPWRLCLPFALLNPRKRCTGTGCAGASPNLCRSNPRLAFLFLRLGIGGWVFPHIASNLRFGVSDLPGN